MNACTDFFSVREPGPITDLEGVNQCLNLALATSRQIAFDWNINADIVCFCGELVAHFDSLPLDSHGCCRSIHFFSIVHEDDRQLLRQSVIRAMKEAEP